MSNDRTGTARFEDSVLRDNPSGGFETAGSPGIFHLGAADPELVRTTVA